jgi:hypothetical protein
MVSLSIDIVKLLALSERGVNSDLLIMKEKIVAKGRVIVHGICEVVMKYSFFGEHLYWFLKCQNTSPNFFAQNVRNFLVVCFGILKTGAKRV